MMRLKPGMSRSQFEMTTTMPDEYVKALSIAEKVVSFHWSRGVQSDDNLKSEFEETVAECERLRIENARLRIRLGEGPDTRDSAAGRSSSHDTRETQPTATITASRPALSRS